MKTSSLLLLLPLLYTPLPAVAEIDLRVVALFNNQALVQLNGQRVLLKAGEQRQDGIRLISADFEEAVIEVHGQRERYNLTNRVSASFTAPSVNEVRITRQLNGAYLTNGEINRQSVTMMVDTGATDVALSEVEARRLGLDYTRGRPAIAHTASGSARAWALELQQVRVGGIELYNIGALVVEGASPQVVLLGMTFLQRVSLQQEDNLMILRGR